MELLNNKHSFAVCGRVDLGEIYEEWRKETGLPDYEEPKDGWTLRHGYAFENGMSALLFENAPGGETTFYRVLFYGGEGETFHRIKKVRFREQEGFRVQAIGIDRALTTLFIRRASDAVARDLRACGIGDKDAVIDDLEKLKDVLMQQCTRRFVLCDGTKVLFASAPDFMRLSAVEGDTFDILYEGGEEQADDEDEDDDDPDLDMNEDDEIDGEGENDDTGCRAEVKKPDKSKKTAMAELREMIGLEGIKRQVDEIVAFAKLQKVAKQHGRKLGGVNLNLTFLGNPGTAKTTVARIFARIMKENGVLSKGGLMEVGRADLVAKYLGQTAIKVKEVFKKAKGNVLFIDEAYSLIDNCENEYGDEAIATIVQEMENRRDDMIVIFAGYPDKMESFLARNPGLRSRVPFTVSFPDYDADELTAIAKSEAARRGYALTDAAERKVRRLSERAMRTAEFGNGRFSRNLVEAAMMRAAVRVMNESAAKPDLRALFRLEESDFALPDNLKQSEPAARPIGFRAA